MNQQRIFLITGANKGLGFEVVKKLINGPLASKTDLILLGSRDLQRGQDAILKLGSPSNVHLIQLDTSSPESIAQATDEIKQKYGGKLNILINNAGIRLTDGVRKLLATNYFGVKLLNQYLSPLIQENGRIINVASEIGAWTLHEMSEDLRNKYKSSTLTEDELDELVNEFFSGLESNKLDQLGYDPKPYYLVYGVSKTALIALTRVQARQWSGAKNVLILSVTPGYCATDLTNHSPSARSAELGADSILHSATAPAIELINGEFYKDGQLESQCYPCNVDLTQHLQNLKTTEKC